MLRNSTNCILILIYIGLCFDVVKQFPLIDGQLVPVFSKLLINHHYPEVILQLPLC